MENKYLFKFTRNALQDYENIYKYIFQELSAPQAADNLIDKMENSIRQLCIMPQMGSYVQNAYLKRKGYRKLIVDNYIIFYIVKDTENTIYIMRILYCGRDYLKYL